MNENQVIALVCGICGLVMVAVIIGIAVPLNTETAFTASLQDELDAANDNVDDLRNQLDDFAGCPECECEDVVCTPDNCDECDVFLTQDGVNLDSEDGNYKVVSIAEPLGCPAGNELGTDTALSACTAACDADDACTHVTADDDGCAFFLGCDEADRVETDDDVLILKKQ